MGDGEFLTASFEVIAAAGPHTLNLGGSEPSMADPAAGAIAMILLGNCGGPPAPTGVTASQGNADGVLVEWEESTGATDYLVYRSASNDPATAAPISGWLPSLLSYLDTGAAPPAVTGGGCAGPIATELQQYFYWVRAINDSLCAGDLSASAEGYRGAAKGLLLKSGAVPAVLPDDPVNDAVMWATPGAALCVRLKAAEAIDPTSVWGAVAGHGFTTDAVQWRPLGDDDGWVVAVPDTAWAPGDVLSMTVGARSRAGAALGPITYGFLVASPDADAGPPPQPWPDALPVAAPGPAGETGGMLAIPLEGEDERAALDFEPLGPGCAILPQEAFEAPRRVWLPLAPGRDATGARVYYYQASGPDHGWHEAGRVDGWLVSDSYTKLEWRGTTYLGLTVRHGGVVRLGAPRPIVSVDGSGLAAAGLYPARGPAGDGLVLLVAAAALWAAAARSGRPGTRTRRPRISRA